MLKNSLRLDDLGDLSRLTAGGFVIFDCETTGLEPDSRIIELGLVFLTTDGVVEGWYDTLLRGNGTVGSSETQSIHGITEESIGSAIEFGEIAEPLLVALSGRVVLAHFAEFDQARLNHELGLISLGPVDTFRCTKTLGQSLGYGWLRLQEAAKKFKIESGRAHRAADDAMTTAQVFTFYLRSHPSEVIEFLTSS
jgi:DNA polymerase III subunit epsilon